MRYFIALIAVTVGLVCGRCHKKWARIDEDCVYFSPNTVTWQDAEAECNNLGGYLVTDDSEEKHSMISFVANVLVSHGHHTFWLGGTDNAVEGDWRWEEHGQAINVTDNSHWDDGYPKNNITRNCLIGHLNKHYMFWRDVSCTGKHSVICEQPQIFTGTTEMPVDTTDDSALIG